jgi:hypothetical protein
MKYTELKYWLIIDNKMKIKVITYYNVGKLTLVLENNNINW